MIDVLALAKCYGDFTAVDDLSFSLKAGSVVGLLGLNGAGKSTTMRMMSGVCRATRGSVRIDGVDVFRDRSTRSRIGFAPEHPPLYADLTVHEYLLHVGRLKKLNSKNLSEQINLRMNDFQLTESRDRLIRNLSRGYRQRLGLAQAFLGDPDFLILDEPTAGLDPRQGADVRGLLKTSASERTVFISTHLLQDVVATCSRVLIVHEGRLVADKMLENLDDMGDRRLDLEHLFFDLTSGAPDNEP